VTGVNGVIIKRTGLLNGFERGKHTYKNDG